MAARPTVLRTRELHTSDRPSLTAQATILMRTVELARPPAARIVTDEFAPAFLSAPSRAALAPLRAAGPVVRRVERTQAASLSTAVLCRHAFIDEHLLATVGDCAHVLVLGAGYDTRAYRFAAELGGRPVFEVDLPPLSRRKAATVAARPDRFGSAAIERVEIDFRTQSLAGVLPDAGFVTGRRTFIIWEGVSMYLSAAAVRTTLKALHALCGRGSVLAMDLWQHVAGHRPYDELRRVGERAIALIGEPLTFATPAAGVDRLFGAAGFEVIDRAESPELAARYATGGRRCDAGLHLVAARLR